MYQVQNHNVYSFSATSSIVLAKSGVNELYLPPALVTKDEPFLCNTRDSHFFIGGQSKSLLQGPYQQILASNINTHGEPLLNNNGM